MNEVDYILADVLSGPGVDPIVVNSGDTLSGLLGGNTDGAQVVSNGNVSTVGQNGYTGDTIQPGDVVSPTNTPPNTAENTIDAPPARPDDLNTAADEASTGEVEEMCAPCADKWLAITITRHTQHKFGGRWDCTIGDLKMEIWDEEDSGSGKLVFECKTSERGGPAHADFVGAGKKAAELAPFMIMARDNYGLAPHASGSYRTYGYNKSYLNKPRPGIAIYGNKGSGAMDERTGVLIHAGTSHRWSVGCIVLHKNGAISDGQYRFDKMTSVNTLLSFFEKIHEFSGKNKLPFYQKIDRLRLIIKESF